MVVHDDDEHALALISEAVEFASGPVIAQLPDADVAFLARAAEAGISAYAESMDPESVQGAIEVAIRRYREAQRLTEKVEQLETALERRAVIERAKGVADGTPLGRRARGVRAACATTRVRATGEWSTSRSRCSTATRCCPSSHDWPLSSLGTIDP